MVCFTPANLPHLKAFQSDNSHFDSQFGPIIYYALFSLEGHTKQETGKKISDDGGKSLSYQLRTFRDLSASITLGQVQESCYQPAVSHPVRALAGSTGGMVPSVRYRHAILHLCSILRPTVLLGKMTCRFGKGTSDPA